MTSSDLKEPGLYWWVRAPGEEAQPVRVTKPQIVLMVFVINERFDDLLEGMPGEFFGPLTVPTHWELINGRDRGLTGRDVPDGDEWCFEIRDHDQGLRRFAIWAASFPTEGEALKEATRLAREYGFEDIHYTKCVRRPEKR